MNWLIVAVIALVLFGSTLAVAEASISRMSRVRALALQEDGRRNAARLVEIESDPPRYLNSIYLAVMLAQNGSAILVTIIAEIEFGSLGITLLSIGFTLLYFVFVEAMSKTYGILHSDRAALFSAPLVWFLARIFAGPTRLLIGLANVLIPGKGLRQGPFVSEDEIRSMAEMGSQEGSIEEGEVELIHSIFEFGDTIVREVMVPRPDIVAIDHGRSLREVQDLVLQHGYSRIPVFREELDDVVGIVYAKDVLKALHQGRSEMPLDDVVREARFVPESKKVAELLREMQQQKFHIAMVSDEHGSVAGLVTLEDLLEELVGEISDEYDRDEPLAEPVGDGVYRVDGKMAIDEVNELLDVRLPQDEWDTVAGLVLGLFGNIPTEGQEIKFDGLEFKAEKVKGRRIAKVLITRLVEEGLEEHEEARGAAE
jgi:CBS domain containing-hemolysin-like protein